MPTAGTAAGTAAAGTQGAITSIGALTGAANQGALAGRQARLRNVRVQRVLGDRAFTIGPSTRQQVLVVLSPNEEQGGAESRVRITEGQTVTMSGTVRRLPGTAQALSQLGVSRQDVSALANRSVYVLAQRVESGQR
jgi:hypothetical protein